MSQHQTQEFQRTPTAVALLWAPPDFTILAKLLTSESPMLLSETNIFPRWQCFRPMYVQQGTLDQEQISHCSKTHSLPNNVEKAAPVSLFPYLWLPKDNFQSLTCQSLTEQSATVLSLILQKATSPKSFSQKHLTNSSSDFQCVSSQKQMFKAIINRPTLSVTDIGDW